MDPASPPQGEAVPVVLRMGETELRRDPGREREEERDRSPEVEVVPVTDPPELGVPRRRAGVRRTWKCMGAASVPLSPDLSSSSSSLVMSWDTSTGALLMDISREASLVSMNLSPVISDVLVLLLLLLLLLLAALLIDME